MVLTGLSFLTLLSLQDHCATALAKDTLMYLAIGFAAMIAMLLLTCDALQPIHPFIGYCSLK